MRFKIDWASLIFGRKFTVFALYSRAISRDIPPPPLGGIYSEGRFNGGFFALRVWGAYIWRGLSTEGHLRFKIDWASLIFGRKFTVFALFCFVFEGNFKVQAPGGAYIRRGDLTEGFLRYEFGGLIFGGAYTWRG